MARPKRSLRTSFVLTVTAATAATPLACGGTAIVSDDGTTQGGTSGSGTGGTRASGGSGSVGGGFSVGGLGGVGGSYADGGVGGYYADFGGAGYAVGGVGGVGGAPSVCPLARPSGFSDAACALPPDAACTYVEHCQSGDVEFSYACTNGYLSLRQTGCRLPYDSCAGTSLWCGPSGWTDFSTGTNPPAPCPSQRPADGTSCSVFDFGANISPCGYYSAGCPQTWVLSSCVATDAGTGVWQGEYCGPTPAP